MFRPISEKYVHFTDPEILNATRFVSGLQAYCILCYPSFYLRGFCSVNIKAASFLPAHLFASYFVHFFVFLDEEEIYSRHWRWKIIYFLPKVFAGVFNRSYKQQKFVSVAKLISVPLYVALPRCWLVRCFK